MTFLAGCGGGSLSALSPAAVHTGGGGTTPTLAAPTFGKPTFINGGSGDCVSGLQFTATGQGATIPVVQPGYSGAYTIANSSLSTASATIASGTVTILAQANGASYVTVKDSVGNIVACNVGVTLSSGTIQ